MSKRSEKRFQEIAEEAIEAAEGERCSFAEFIEGLAQISEQIRDRLRAAQDEQRGRDKAEDAEIEDTEVEELDFDESDEDDPSYADEGDEL